MKKLCLKHVLGLYTVLGQTLHGGIIRVLQTHFSRGFFSNLYGRSDFLCEYGPEEPSTLLVDDVLGGKCNTNYVCHI